MKRISNFQHQNVMNTETDWIKWLFYQRLKTAVSVEILALQVNFTHSPNNDTCTDIQIETYADTYTQLYWHSPEVYTWFVWWETENNQRKVSFRKFIHPCSDFTAALIQIHNSALCSLCCFVSFILSSYSFPITLIFAAAALNAREDNENNLLWWKRLFISHLQLVESYSIIKSWIQATPRKKTIEKNTMSRTWKITREKRIYHGKPL